MSDQPQYKSVDKYDRMAGMLAGLPDVAVTQPTLIQAITPLTGESESFIIKTYRQREVGDTIFLEYGEGDRRIRIVLPPKVSDAISRQRDALTAKNRRTAARATAAARKARGELPGFMKKKGKKAAKTSGE
jgi:hypothetical protein